MSKATDAFRRALDVLDTINEIFTKAGIICETPNGSMTNFAGIPMGGIFEYRVTKGDMSLRWGINYCFGDDAELPNSGDVLLTSVEWHLHNHEEHTGDVPRLCVNYDAFTGNRYVDHEPAGSEESLRDIWSAFPDIELSDEQATAYISDIAQHFLAGRQD